MMDEFYEKIKFKLREVLGGLHKSEWSTHAQELDENYSLLQSKVDGMRAKYANPSMKGKSVPSYTNPPKGHSRYHEVNGNLEMKSEYISIYDPIKECWRDFESELSRENFIVLIRDEPIENIFVSHLYYACMSFELGSSVINEDEQVAFEAFIQASELFDKCLGMLWFKSYLENKNKLSIVRSDSGKKGGVKKAEIYKVIQSELIELIYAKAPEEGWRSKTAAVDYVLDSLWTFVERKKLDGFYVKNIEALRDRVFQWSVKIEAVRNAFNAKVTRVSKKSKVVADSLNKSKTP